MTRVSSKTFNRHDYGIVILIGLLVFGGIGGAYQPIRIIGVIFSPLVFFRLFETRIPKRYYWTLLFFVIWMIYCIVSVIWTWDRSEAFKEIIYFYSHFSIFFLLVYKAKNAKNPLKAILIGWVCFLIFTLPVAMYEILTYQHLPISRFGSDRVVNLGGSIVQQRFASVTFSNSNTYVVLLIFCLPFLYGAIMSANKIRQKAFLSCLLITCCIVLIINSSRGGVLCFAITSLIFLLFNFKGQLLKLKNLFLLVSLIFVLGWIFSSYSEDIFRHFFYRIGEGGSLLEDNSRSVIYGNAFSLIKDSLFMGTGAGSEVAAMSSVSNGILTTHNLFLEVLLQYGFIIFYLFCLFLGRIFIKIRFVENNIAKFILWSFLCSFLPLFVINSGYLLMPAFWVLMSSLFVLGTNEKVALLSN